MFNLTMFLVKAVSSVGNEMVIEELYATEFQYQEILYLTIKARMRLVSVSYQLVWISY